MALAPAVGADPALLYRLLRALASLRALVLAIALEPFGLDQAAAQRGGGLLILAGEVVFADRSPDAVEGVGQSRSGLIGLRE